MWPREALANWRHRRALAAVKKATRQMESLTRKFQKTADRNQAAARLKRNWRIFCYGILASPFLLIAAFVALAASDRQLNTAGSFVPIPREEVYDRVEFVPAASDASDDEATPKQRTKKLKAKKRSSSRVWVSGYTRSNGTRVRGHWRQVR